MGVSGEGAALRSARTWLLLLCPEIPDRSGGKGAERLRLVVRRQVAWVGRKGAMEWRMALLGGSNMASLRHTRGETHKGQGRAHRACETTDIPVGQPRSGYGVRDANRLEMRIKCKSFSSLSTDAARRAQQGTARATGLLRRRSPTSLSPPSPPPHGHAHLRFANLRTWFNRCSNPPRTVLTRLGTLSLEHNVIWCLCQRTMLLHFR